MLCHPPDTRRPHPDVRHAMDPEEREPFTPAEWERFEDELWARAREIAHRLAESVRRATGRWSPDGPTGEVPVFW